MAQALWYNISRGRVARGGGGGGACNFLYMAKYRCVCQMAAGVCAKWPPFSALPGILLAPFFNKKYMTDSNFLGWYMKGTTTFLTSRYMHILFA